MKDVPLTASGLERLREELDYLRTVRRGEIGDEIRNALNEAGDFSENSMYLDAKEEQARLERRIALLEDRLAHATVIETSAIGDGSVGLGSHVRLRDLETGEELDYQLVSSVEALQDDGKLSSESPVGAAILGHRRGDSVEVEAPRGWLTFEVVDVRAPDGE